MKTNFPKSVLIWSARTSPRFGTGRHVAQSESGDVSPHSKSGGCRGFSLLEVMVAMAVFFIGAFAVLSLISSSLGNVRRLQRPTVDAGVLAAQLSITNKLVEGSFSGNLGDQLGDAYKDYSWTEVITEERTNKLFRVDIAVQNATGNHEVVSEVNLLLFRPQSDAGSLDGGNFIKR